MSDYRTYPGFKLDGAGPEEPAAFTRAITKLREEGNTAVIDMDRMQELSRQVAGRTLAVGRMADQLRAHLEQQNPNMTIGREMLEPLVKAVQSHAETLKLQAKGTTAMRE